MPNCVDYSSDKDLILKKGQMDLVRVRFDMLEMIRAWRNSPEIAQCMLDQTYITYEAQQKWFKRISISRDSFYFLVSYKNIPIGLASIYDINFEKKETNTGLYIAHKDFLNSSYGFKAFYILTDFAFNTLNLESYRTTIKKSNTRAIRFDRFLGYEFSKNIDDTLDEYILYKKVFLEKKTIYDEILKTA